MEIPRWFLQELEIIDPTYYVKYNKEYNYFEIKKKINAVRDGELIIVAPTLAVFRRLNHRSLDNLRQRKAVGRQYEGDMTKYMQWVKGLGREAKIKSKQLALEMQAEGYMRIHRRETSKTFT